MRIGFDRKLYCCFIHVADLLRGIKNADSMCHIIKNDESTRQIMLVVQSNVMGIVF